MLSTIKKEQLFFILLLISSAVYGQKDTLKTTLKWHQRKSFKVAAVPMFLTAAAITTMSVDQHTDISKYSIQSEFLEQPQMIRTNIEDKFRYAPVAMVYGLNLVGIKGENNFGERTIILSKAILLQHAITTVMKRGFHMARPGGGGYSFPSAHTARAFATATFMHYEYKEVSPWYSVAGYSFAVATGALRVVNNHHWLPDVLVGAGIGILSTKLVYLTHKHKLTKWLDRWGEKKEKESKLTLLPSYTGEGPGVYLNLQL
ncbi:phosphatase PAP2 family protein [Fulvivirga sp. 29W222]|uniref:Phosphatase PAP2 family protein n=1 Tax=Fulvivirga marina TaxID=2494733 RepID=A0A937FZE4_9BACT|nr:phosphatase PAP2 family protein [Fulvivirga marina]MBL6447778.1 phosphatase PAP2 family protein [Fulvivirga marina]